jgi:hypothetical protein
MQVESNERSQRRHSQVWGCQSQLVESEMHLREALL